MADDPPSPSHLPKGTASWREARKHGLLVVEAARIIGLSKRHFAGKYLDQFTVKWVEGVRVLDPEEVKAFAKTYRKSQDQSVLRLAGARKDRLARILIQYLRLAEGIADKSDLAFAKQLFRQCS